MKPEQIRNCVLAVLIAVAISGPSVFAQQKSVEQRLQELEQEIQTLKQQLAAAKVATTAPAKAPETAIVKAGADGFIVQSVDSNFKLRVGGYAQADGRLYLNDRPAKGSAGNGTDTFLLRRVRPIIEGTVWRDFDFRIVSDFGNGAAASAIMQDAYI